MANMMAYLKITISVKLQKVKQNDKKSSDFNVLTQSNIT